MAISRERQVYAAVLVLAGGALVIDRGFIGMTGAKTVHAAEMPPNSQSTPQPASARSTSSPGPASSLAFRLRQVALPADEADLFEATLRKPHPETPAPAHPEPRPSDEGRKQFASSHHLSAIATNAKGSNALVNGRAVQIGEEIDGFRLIEVTRSSAIFESPEGRVELRLPQPR